MERNMELYDFLKKKNSNLLNKYNPDQIKQLYK